MRAKNCAWCGDDLKLEDIKGYVQRIKCGTESDLKNHGCKVIIAKPTVEGKVEKCIDAVFQDGPTFVPQV